MRTETVAVSNGTMKIPAGIRSYLKLKEEDTVLIEANRDGSVSIRRKDSIADLKGIIKKDKSPGLYANSSCQF